jgi:hypothetical protein
MSRKKTKKNDAMDFFEIAELLDKHNALEKSLYIFKSKNSNKDPLKDPSTLIVLNFEIDGGDIGGIAKMIFMPLSDIYSSNTPGAEKIRKVLQNFPQNHIL